MKLGGRHADLVGIVPGAERADVGNGPTEWRERRNRADDVQQRAGLWQVQVQRAAVHNGPGAGMGRGRKGWHCRFGSGEDVYAACACRFVATRCYRGLRSLVRGPQQVQGPTPGPHPSPANDNDEGPGTHQQEQLLVLSAMSSRATLPHAAAAPVGSRMRCTGAAPVCEYLVEHQRREGAASQPEAHMDAGSRVHQRRLTRVDHAEQLTGVAPLPASTGRSLAIGLSATCVSCTTSRSCVE